ncbi:WD40 repeat domain-containing protein [Coleofasciculus sp. FACHB-129]|uniref:WD40 repeat domain-containing protein n=1 Tax=Cyanophyceae TaxID=3028117 RepID=UPI001688180B|nr:WD40 repeat domain-containing protein [Coleofasciculus sp. FACHB-129]MBD1897723.1 WD40 repeat domain-containing protein [Coleofasciculus sp. FACHB-129]
MPFNIVGAVAVFVASAASRIASKFFKNVVDDTSNLPAKVQEVRLDQRSRQAEIDYYRRREVREQKLLELQDLRLKADLQIESASAERDERTLKLRERELQLKAEELADKRQMSSLYLELMREKTAKEIELKQKEIQAIFDQQKWPGVLSRDEVERIFGDEQKKPRLLMLVPPPDISDDFPLSFRDSLKKEVRNQLKGFLERHYSLEGELCPVEFYGKYFERSIFDAEVKQLETILAAVPTAIIYSDITDHEVYFNVRFWGLQDTVSLSFEPWNWEEAKKQLQEAGNDEIQSLRIIRQTIVTLHKLLATFLADWYYLNIDPNYEPQLFNLDSEIPNAWAKTITDKLKLTQQQYQKAYNTDLKLLADWETSKTQPWRCVDTLSGHSNHVYAVAISADGQIASGSADNTITIWDLTTGDSICTFTGHSGSVSSLAFSPDGQTLASGSADNTIKLWYSRTGVTFTGHSDELHSIAFSPNGKIVASGSKDKTIKVWDFNTGKEICTLTGHEERVSSIIFSANGQNLISGSSDKTIKIWDLSTGKAIRTLTEHLNYVWSVAISPDGKTLVSGSADTTIKIWSFPSGSLLHTFSDHTSISIVRSIAFSPDGQILASVGNDKTIKLWHLGTRELIHTLSGHLESIGSVVFSPDGKTIVSGSNDKTIKIWQYD